MYLKTDNLGHHEIVDGELSASEKSLPPEYQDAYDLEAAADGGACERAALSRTHGWHSQYAAQEHARENALRTLRGQRPIHYT